MALIRLHKNPMGSIEAVETYSGELMAYIEKLSWCRSGVVVNVNGVKVADSGEMKPREMVKALSVHVSVDDCVDIYARPFDVGTFIIYALVGLGLAAVAISLTPKPRSPNDLGQGDNEQSPNNQLNAANNSFRPNQAIPDIAGKITAYPDFIQRSFYEYVNNRREFTEVMCFGMGRYTVDDVRDGTTLFDDLPDSDFAVYDIGAGDTIPPEVLIDVRAVEASIDLPLPASDEDTRSRSIIGGDFLGINGDTVYLGDESADIFDTLDLQVGDTVTIDVTYSPSSGTTSTYSVTASISSTNEPLGRISLSPVSLPFAEPQSVNGIIKKNFGSSVGQWFILEGDEIEEIRWHLAMPSGIRKGDGTDGIVTYRCEYEEVDAAGDPVSGGQSGLIIGSFIGNTQDPQFQTRKKTGLTASRFRAKAYRTSDSLGNNAADLLRVDRIESVTPYSGSNFPDVTIGVFYRRTASQQGRGASTKVNARVTRKLRLFNATTGAFDTSYTATRAAEQYVMYTLTQASVPLSLINYEELFEATESLGILGQFDYSFDSYNISLRERVETALNAARCYNYMQGAVWRFGRDEAKAIRTFIINRRNLVPQSFKMSEQLFITNDYDSIELEYIDPVNNTKAYVRRRINETTGAIESGLGLRVDKIALAGCRNEAQAINRAELEIRKLKYINKIVECQVLPDILAANVGERGGVINPANSTFTDGEILEVDGDTLTLSEPVSTDGYIYFVESDGSVSDSLPYTRVSDYVVTATGNAAFAADGYEVQLGSKFIAAQSNDFVYTDYVLKTRGRPDSEWRVPCQLVPYDARVYELD